MPLSPGVHARAVSAGCRAQGPGYAGDSGCEMNLLHAQQRLQGNPAGRALLTAASWVYGSAVMARSLLYRVGLLRRQRLPVRTICFGNLTAGGTGKTSAVLLAARFIRKQERRVAILSRGYRKLDRSADMQVLLDAHDIPWEKVGD